MNYEELKNYAQMCKITPKIKVTPKGVKIHQKRKITPKDYSRIFLNVPF